MQLLRLEISVANSAVSPQRKPECYACPQFVNRPSIQDRMAHCDIDGEILVDLPDQSDEAGHRFKLPEFLLIEDFANGSHRPFSWTLDDGAQEDIAMVLTRKRGAVFRWTEPQSQRCDTIQAALAPKPEAPTLSGRSTPNSVATLGPGLSWRLPGLTTPFRNAPAADRLEGPDAERGVSTRPSRTPSHLSVRPKLKRVAGAISVVPESSCKRPAGCNSTSIFPGSATAASVPSNGRNAKAGEVASAATHRQATNTQSLFDCVDAESFRNLVMSQLTQLGFRASGGIPKYSRVARLPPSPRAAAGPVLERRAMYAPRKPLECAQCACIRSPQRRAHRGTPRHS